MYRSPTYEHFCKTATMHEKVNYSYLFTQDYIISKHEEYYERDEIAPNSLDLNKYGFLDTDIVSFDGPQVPLQIDLSDCCQEMYAKLVKIKKLPATEFAQSVAQIVNDSMTYEFSIITNLHRSENRVAATKYYEHAKANYVKPPNTTLQGVCADAGTFIRKIIYEKRPQYPFWFCKASLHTKLNDGDRITHDTTLFYNKERWILINSLSPTNMKYILEPDNLQNKQIRYNNGPREEISQQFT